VLLRLRALSPMPESETYRLSLESLAEATRTHLPSGSFFLTGYPIF
jgi:hypothetical protein